MLDQQNSAHGGHKRENITENSGEGSCKNRLQSVQLAVTALLEQAAGGNASCGEAAEPGVSARERQAKQGQSQRLRDARL